MNRTESEKKLRRQILSLCQEYYDTAFKNRLDYAKNEKIHYGGRVFDHEELNHLMDACLDFWLTEGRYVEDFSSSLKDYLNVKHCCLTNSGSSANLLAFYALTTGTFENKPPISPGDEIITVAAGFPTTIAPIVQFGAVPVFVDISLPTYNIDCALLEEALSPKTKGVMLAHTLGNPFDIDGILSFCRTNKLWLIEDNCDALGSRYFHNGIWKQTGSFGDVATSSFYPPHHITTGEGGAAYTSDPRIHRNLMSIRDWGRDCWCSSGHDDTCKNRFSRQYGDLPLGYDHKYVYSNFGYNLKMTDLQAAIGVAQMKKLPEFTKRRKQNWQFLRNGLDYLEDVFILPEPTPNSDPSWFGFPLTIRKGSSIKRDAVVEFLESSHIQTRMLFAGNIIRQPCFNKMRAQEHGYRQVGSLAVTDAVMNDTFWIGVYPGLSESHLEYMLQTFHSFFKNEKHYKK